MASSRLSLSLSPSSERINIRVIDPFTIKPLDSKTIIDNARATRGRIITVEDHYYEGEECDHTAKIAKYLSNVTVLGGRIH